MPKPTDPKFQDLVAVMRNMQYKVGEAKRRSEAAFADLGPDADLEDLIKSACRPMTLKVEEVQETPKVEQPAEIERPKKKVVQVQPPKRPRGRKQAEEETPDTGDAGSGVLYLILVLFGAAFLTGLFFLGIARGLPIVLICGVILYRMGKTNTRRVRS